MVIALSGLNAGIIGLESAAIFVVGSNLGTTVTIVLGATNGSAPKKRVAASHVTFNLFTDLIALILIHPLLWIIREAFDFTNPLYALVAFHSIFNFLGILLLLPFIGLLTRKLEGWFHEKENRASFIAKVPVSVPEAAIEALQNEIVHLTGSVIYLNIKGLRLPMPEKKKEGSWFRGFNYREKYAELKELEGEIVSYFLQIQSEKLESEEADKLTVCNLAMRNAMQSAKGIKDIEHNIREFVNSSNDAKLELTIKLQAELSEVYKTMSALFNEGNSAVLFESLTELANRNQSFQQQFTTETYIQTKAKKLNDMEVSTFLNAIREIYSANKLLIHALTNIHLNKQQAEDFAKLPENQFMK
jgi:phosphate:Na+ symporter